MNLAKALKSKQLIKRKSGEFWMELKKDWNKGLGKDLEHSFHRTDMDVEANSYASTITYITLEDVLATDWIVKDKSKLKKCNKCGYQEIK